MEIRYITRTGAFMPGYKGHLAGAVFLGFIAIGILVWFGLLAGDPRQLLVLGILIILGALFPDVDTDSKGQNLFYALLAAFDLGLMICGYYKWAAILGFFAMLPAVGRHRGWTHTWWAMLAVPLPVIILPYIFYAQELSVLLPYYPAMVFGYFTHLLLDRTF